jgi:ABC-type Fe3+-hydroxamate transport system substrate-binding protein
MPVGISGGFGKIDEGCDIRETARSFSGISKLAQCKLLVNEKQSKKAGITLEDCMGPPIVVPQQTKPVAVVEPVAPVIIIEQAPLVLPQAPVVLPRVKKKVAQHHHLPPNCQNEVIRVCK